MKYLYFALLVGANIRDQKGCGDKISGAVLEKLKVFFRRQWILDFSSKLHPLPSVIRLRNLRATATTLVKVTIATTEKFCKVRKDEYK
ncbi:hypothetical protein HW45_01225 [Vibrio sp. ER1A]|nr:hypothetical protein HW45_01225 [Vibrio sp. ER1A]